MNTKIKVGQVYQYIIADRSKWIVVTINNADNTCVITCLGTIVSHNHYEIERLLNPHLWKLVKDVSDSSTTEHDIYDRLHMLLSNA